MSEVIAQSTMSLASIKTVKEAAHAAEELAGQAKEFADNAHSEAERATGYANSALLQLSEVEKVVDVLSWVSKHGEYNKTADTMIIPGKYYFTRKPVYALTNDTAIDIEKVYYTLTGSPATLPSISTVYEQENERIFLSDDEGFYSTTKYYTVTADEIIPPDLTTYYELSNDIYSVTNDQVVNFSKTYYTLTGTAIEIPSTEALYELFGDTYSITADQTIIFEKQYYSLAAMVVSDPVSEDLGTYYELDEGQLNYIRTSDVAVNPEKVYYTIDATSVLVPKYYDIDNNIYSITSDISADASKTYYVVNGTVIIIPSYYELDNGVYFHTNDQIANAGKTYYTINLNELSIPDSSTLYLLDANSKYVLMSGDYIDATKNYYTVTPHEVTSPITTDLEQYYERLYLYEVVLDPESNPEAADYYELVGVDKAISNYVSTHLALTNEGLFIQMDKTNTKIRISSDGVYVYNSVGDIVATYSDSVTLGDADGLHITLTSGELGFWQGPNALLDNKVAYISSNKLFIKSAEVTEELRIGNFVWEIKDDGNRISLIYSPS